MNIFKYSLYLWFLSVMFGREITILSNKETETKFVLSKVQSFVSSSSKPIKSLVRYNRNIFYTNINCTMKDLMRHRL